MTIYFMCKHCDHFVDENHNPDNDPDLATHIHLEDGEQEFDHDAEPSGEGKTLEQWHQDRPDLFVLHADGNVGPNSIHHSQRGKD